ncbi:MAG: aminotransferase class V-fold PLP-dependent enzyme [Thermomicrobiales bacterium]|nr:aminotransferase class V-fold PLP-dependent enzyme [Thermomicrobiales bacterium]
MTNETIYDRIGVRSIINGRGPTTIVGGSLMEPEVLAAMAEAATRFVDIEELNRAVGQRIAEVTGAEAGYVACGSAAAMALAVAACIAGTDPVKIDALPDSDGLANEIILHRAHRIPYDRMYRAGGGRLVLIGTWEQTDPRELEEAITDRTAAVAFNQSQYCGPGALSFDQVVEIAHARNVPVIVDAASTLPPVNHLRIWIERGADLVIYSGGKGIRGPQETSLLAGRAELIAAARANGSPNAAVGRGGKVSKESMIGLWVALERFLTHDHDADYRRHMAQADRLEAAFAGRPDLRLIRTDDQAVWPFPVIGLYPVDNRWAIQDVARGLIDGEPSIHLDPLRDRLQINTHWLEDDQIDPIIRRLTEELDARCG